MSAGGPRRCVQKSLKLAECTPLIIGVSVSWRRPLPLDDFGVIAGQGAPSMAATGRTFRQDGFRPIDVTVGIRISCRSSIFVSVPRTRAATARRDGQWGARMRYASGNPHRAGLTGHL